LGLEATARLQQQSGSSRRWHNQQNLGFCRIKNPPPGFLFWGFCFLLTFFFGLGSEQTKVWATIETKNSQQKLFEHNVSSIPQYQQNMVWVDHAGWTHCLKRNFFVCVVWTAKSHLVDFCWPKKISSCVFPQQQNFAMGSLAQISSGALQHPVPDKVPEGSGADTS